jgi:hypothetical protein
MKREVLRLFRPGVPPDLGLYRIGVQSQCSWAFPWHSKSFISKAFGMPYALILDRSKAAGGSLTRARTIPEWSQSRVSEAAGWVPAGRGDAQGY